ncbi:hypothetical protein LOK49_LG01G03015 [Camellia lanceoleosa]|uniref:Uncharacterized protein n=1 Tax=Camellia lanceoleosa TaxID=1840588 RepID=A0ACC0IYW1_9ERIC|nr:hypothetical protein LOK49_LG01G03015 [Camellia lanceoleosa]
MLETPNFFVVNSASLQIGRRFSALNADEDLEIANVYVMFPMKRLNSMVTAADMGALFLTANSAAKNIRVLPEPQKMEQEEAVPKLNVDDIEEFSMPEFKHRLSMCRSKKPLLETIVEEPVCFSEWEDLVNLSLLSQAWSYRGPPEQQGQGWAAHVLLACVLHYGTVIAIDGIDLGADGDFDFYILSHLQKDVEDVVPEEESQEESSSSEATISDIMPLKNFLEIATARKRERAAAIMSASQTSSDLVTTDRPQHSSVVIANDYSPNPVVVSDGSIPSAKKSSKQPSIHSSSEEKPY